ncbi:MAG: exosome complex RNA-binding protein Rrp4 [Candidatus Bathyarchaeia archaeon]|nr:S1 RNA-binding domain-containing protein [Candidatus Bathyarchaeota archaeon]
MTILVQKKQLVIPGELVAQGEYEPDLNVYKDGENIYSTMIGFFEYQGSRISVVPLKHCYFPFVDDIIIGKITDVGMSGWYVDINSPYSAMLPVTEFGARQNYSRKRVTTESLSVGDLVKAKIIAFDRSRDPLLSARDRELGKITRGRMIKITPSKIPRLIGKEGSMINLLKKESACSLSVGQNGIVLVTCNSPKNEEVVVELIKMIEHEAHTQGLTDRVSEVINRKLRGVKTGKA